MPDGEEQQGHNHNHNHNHNHGSGAIQASPILTDQFAALIRTMFTGVVVTRPDGVIVEANETFGRSLGFSHDELIGRSTAQLALYEDPSTRARVYEELERCGEVRRLAVHLRHRDGTRRSFLLTVKPLELGGTACLVGLFEDVTELRRVDAALQESESQLRAMFDVVPVGIVQVDLGTQRLTRVNPAMCILTGYSAKELLSLRISDITHPEDRAADAETFGQLVGGEASSARHTTRYVRKDGMVVWCTVDFRLMHPSQQGGVAAVAVIVDETERHVADAATHLLTSALQAADNSVVITDLSGTIYWANAAFSRLSGYAPAEIVGASTSLLKSGTQDAAFYREMWTTIRAGKTWHGELVNRRKDGQRYTEDMTITPVRDGQGQISHFIAIKQDITERKRVAETLRASEDRYRSLVDNLEEVVFSIDLQGKLTFVNRALTGFGYQPEDVIGRSIHEFIHPEDLVELKVDFARRIAGAAHGPVEFRWMDSSGKPRYLRNSTRPLFVNGEIVGLTGLATDVTVQRETEEQLRAAHRMEAIGRLAGGVAHDFNNILSVISSYTEFALEELREGDPLRADLHEIAAAGQRAAALTRQLLAFSRQQVLEPKRLDLGELVAGVTKMLRRLIGEDVTLHVTVADGLFFTRVDPGQIEQVLMNLAVNARDAMPEGGELQLELQNCVLDPERARTVDLPPGSYVEMVVTDTGAGMTPAVQARIFEPFFTTKALGKGTGLGLSMVHGIVKQSGGGISVETAPGRGTAFHVYFPQDASVATVAEVAASTLPVEPGGHGRILVVEDEGALRNVVMRMLRSCGYDVLVAASPGEALLICEEHGDTFDLLLTDVVMPGMSGRRLAERLHPLCPRARVMFMSGYTDEMIEHHGVLGNHFLRKPFDRATLTTRVRSVLDEPVPTT